MLQKFISAFTEYAHAAGITRLQFYVEQSEEQKLQVFQSELERLQLAQLCLIYVEAEYEGKQGSTFVENLSEELFAEHVANIKQTALVNNTDFVPRNSYAVCEPAVTITDLATSLWAERLQTAEKAAYAIDPRIKLVGDCSCVSQTKSIMLLDDSGGKMEDCLHYYRASVGVVAEANGQMQTARVADFARELEKLDLTALAEKAATQAIAMLEAEPVATGNYRVILHNRVVCDLLLTFLPAFYADRVQNSMSRMAGKLGQQVAVDSLSLIEDPDFALGIMRRRFDDEGIPTKRKEIIADGWLRCYFHNQKTAHKEGAAPTGNGFKRDYTEKPTISPTNLYLRRGEATLETLQQRLGEGLLITECDGMFAGADSVSGDFSLIAKGFYVNQGETVRPVAQITIAGNFFDLLHQIEAIGNDYASDGSENGFVSAPSLLTPSLAVSGK